MANVRHAKVQTSHNGSATEMNVLDSLRDLYPARSRSSSSRAPSIQKKSTPFHQQSTTQPPSTKEIKINKRLKHKQSMGDNRNPHSQTDSNSTSANVFMRWEKSSIFFKSDVALQQGLKKKFQFSNDKLRSNSVVSDAAEEDEDEDLSEYLERQTISGDVEDVPFRNQSEIQSSSSILSMKSAPVQHRPDKHVTHSHSTLSHRTSAVKLKQYPSCRSAQVDCMSAVMDGSDERRDAVKNDVYEYDNEDNEDGEDDYESGEDGIGSFIHHIGHPIIVKIQGRRQAVLRFHPVKTMNVLDQERLGVVGCMLAFKMGKTRTRLIRATLTQHGFMEVPESSVDFNILWATSHTPLHELKLLGPNQKINHFPRSYEITRKDRLHINIQRMQQAKGKHHFQFLPRTYLLPAEHDEFVSDWMKAKGAWIVKPAASSQGRGIFLINHPKQLPQQDTVVVSQYVDNPLLVDGFKFDLRVYVAVTSYDPMRIYVYEDGLARFATTKYDTTSPSNLSNTYMHLTNYSLNKRSSNFVACDEEGIEDYGNKWSLSALLRHLKSGGINTEMLMARVEEVIIKTIIAGEVPVVSATRAYLSHPNICFELYGFDILIDAELKPWLLEVNLSPSLTCDSLLDFKVKSHLLADFLNLGHIPFADPPIYHPYAPRTRRSRRKGPKLPPSIPILEMNWPDLKRYSTERKAILRRSIEEEIAAETTGFMRIFPCEGSWKQYGFLLEDAKGHNTMLAEFLFPRSKNTTAKPSRGIRSRKLQEPLITSQLKYRCRKYRRMLRNRNALRGFPEDTTESKRDNSNNQKNPVDTDKRNSCLVEGEEWEGFKGKAEQSGLSAVGDDVDRFCYPCEKGEISTEIHQESLTKASILRHEGLLECKSRFRVDDVHGKANDTVRSTHCTSPLLFFPHSISPIQARLAFAEYLKRMRDRMLAGSRTVDWTPILTMEWAEQVELLSHFLRRASKNLPASLFHGFPKDSRMSLADRLRAVATKLGEFVDLYNLETRRQRVVSDDFQPGSTSPDTDFELFLQLAREEELEDLLRRYSNTTRDTSIFLGPRNGPQSRVQRSHITSSFTGESYRTGANGFSKSDTNRIYSSPPKRRTPR